LKRPRLPEYILQFVSIALSIGNRVYMCLKASYLVDSFLSVLGLLPELGRNGLFEMVSPLMHPNGSQLQLKALHELPYDKARQSCAMLLQV